ncbi:MAG: 5-formyltetrahydrofolate cyclo-ligase [Clostridia bacterium]|nr:5-formyltetrahydrofolate cyclo-ligase [Clostridia bacterium]
MMKAKRNSLSDAEVQSKSLAVCETVKQMYPNRDMYVCAYASIQNEVDISALFTFYKNVFLPVTEGDTISFYRLSETLTKGLFGVPEPERDAMLTCEPDVVLVPGVAFDEQQNRTGYGKGYYDRFLKNKACDAVGIAYDFQVVGRIEDVHESDMKMNKIITERRVIDGTE